MIIGSHNSWSYLPPLRWWMKPVAFMAKCQRVDIRKQYEQGVRCFDLRVRFNKYGQGIVAHGIVEYCYTASQIYKDLAWLNDRGDCYVRVIHEVRSASQYKNRCLLAFGRLCSRLESEYEDICFWCGRNLYDWEKDYDFGIDPTCEENYGSVSSKWLAWWPWLYARLHNRSVLAAGTQKDILLIDFVDITK